MRWNVSISISLVTICNYPTILNELIDKIVVHHKEVAEDGRVFQQVEIYYRFIGKLEHAAESEKAA